MKKVSLARTWAAFGASAILVSVGMATATPAMAATTTVTTEQELVEAIIAANFNPDPDTIVLSGGGITLTDNLPMVTSALTLTGPGSDVFTIDANNLDLSDINTTYDVINAQMVPSDGPVYLLTLSGFTISNTAYIGIYVNGPSVSIDDVVITEGVGPEACGLELNNLSGTVTNSAFHAGCGEATVGIYGQEVVSISNTEFSGLAADGLSADLSGDTTLALDNVTSAYNGGAGIYLDAGGNSVVTVTGSALNENAGNGVKVDGYESAQVRLNGIDAINNSGSGVFLDIYDRPQVALNDIEVTGNAGHGVELIAGDDATTTIVGGLVNGSGASGFYLDTYNSAHVGLDGVEVSGNSGHGIELSGVDETTSTFTNVIAAGNGSTDEFNYGLRLVAGGTASVDVVDTITSENGYGGLYAELEGKSTTEILNLAATNNVVTQAETYVLDGATLSIDGVTATGAADAGVLLSSESTVPIVAKRLVSTGNSPGLALFSYVPEAAFDVTASSVSGSSEAPGVFIFGTGTVSIAASTVTDNPFGGVFIQSDASLVTISDATIADNGGGAGSEWLDSFGGVLVFSDEANVLIDRSTISGNTAVAGAGIYAGRWETQLPGVINITSSTISGNTAEQSGALQFESGVAAVISHTTITDNTSADNGPAVELEERDSVISHTIIADNRQGTDLFAEPATTINYSLIGEAEDDAPVLTALQNGTGNLIGMSAKLGPLANNGATTLTHLPLAGSPAIDSGNPQISGAPALDQRDAKRIVRVIDIGAVEVAAVTPGGGGGNTIANTGSEGVPAWVVGTLLALVSIGAGSMVLGMRRGLRA